MQFAVAVGIRADGGVVPRGDGVEAQVERLLEQCRELDALVAAHARVRGAAGGVLGDEVVDDVELEPLGEVPHVVRDPDEVRGALGVHRVLDGAAAAAAGAQGARHPAEREVHADHLVAGVDGARCRDRGVHSPAHGCQNFHAYQHRCPRPAPLAPDPVSRRFCPLWAQLSASRAVRDRNSLKRVRTWDAANLRPS